jgi:AcrR family transcriptional regulator
MGTLERRERERQEIRIRILDAARELFAAEGYEAVTMRTIAEKIEYSATAIYHHFKDKDALVAELCRHDFREFSAHFMKVAAIEDPVLRLRAAGRAYFDFAEKFPQHYRFMFMTPRPPVPPEEGEKEDPAQNAYVFLRSIVEEAIKKGLMRPELRDPELLAQTIWAGTHGVMALDIAFDKERQWVDWRPLRARQDQLVDAIFRATLREPGRYVGRAKIKKGSR